MDGPGRVFALYSSPLLPPRTVTEDDEYLGLIVPLLVHRGRKFSLLEVASDNARTDKKVIAIFRGSWLFVVAPTMDATVSWSYSWNGMVYFIFFVNPSIEGHFPKEGPLKYGRHPNFNFVCIRPDFRRQF